MERRHLLLGGLAAVLATRGRSLMVGGNGHRRRVTEADIAGVHDWARSYRETDFRRGGVVAREGAMVQLVAATGLLDADCSERLRPALHRAVGDLAEAAGFAAFDAGQWKEADAAWRFGLSCLEGADDAHMWTQLMASLARQEIWLGRPGAGVARVDRAIRTADDLTPRELAMLWAVRARGLAAMGKVIETRYAIDNSDDYMADLDPGRESEVVPWLMNYDEAMHSGNVAHALTDLVVVGHDRMAEMAAQRQVEAMLGSKQPRCTLFATILGATVVMRAGSPEQAVELGHDAMDTMPLVSSARASSMLRKLQEVARDVDRADVADLRARIGRVA